MNARVLNFIFTISLVCNGYYLFSQQATITIDPAAKGNAVSPTLHGVFFEEISHAGEGGLYAELIQNRGFEEATLPEGTTLIDGFLVPPRTPHFSMPNNGISDWKMPWTLNSPHPAWTAEEHGAAEAQLSVTAAHPLNKTTPHALQVTISNADKQNNVDVINEGFWGISVTAGSQYNLSFYVRSEGYKGNITASLQRRDGQILASQTFSTAHAHWKKYTAALKATETDKNARFVLSFDQPGTVWLDFVSLFPAKTFKNRPNGLRMDLAQHIADLKPAFIRWPGGCFVEGITIQSAPDWKKTIGPVEKRPGTYSPWGYWCSNGFGYHEFLQYCEDIGAAALYVFNAGVSCDYRSGTFASDDSLQPYIQSALEAIEYAIGPATSKWGRVRAAAGHPAPFPLKYVEVGNEQHGPRYAERYNRFYEAINAKYPSLRIIASMGIGDVNEHTLRNMKKVDIADEHAYKAAGWAMQHFDHFDTYKRGAWDVYVGEYATNAGVGAGNLEAALNDAIYVMSMEKAGDLVKMSSYAPLLVNTNDVDWPVNLINFNAAQSVARISYYTIKMMNENRADYNVPVQVRVTKPPVKTPAFAGSIGLATWDTKTAYKDIEVIANGETLYKSDFGKRVTDWALVRGAWHVQDSALAQTAAGAQQFAMLKNKRFDTYTLKLKAKKLDGYNAFIIPFAVKDTNTFLRAHIGSWLNTNCVYEKVTNGFDVINIVASKPLPKPIEANRWYAIELHVGMDTVKCYLDGELLMVYTEPEKVFAIAGRDETKGELIVKMVNAYGSEVPVALNLGTETLTGKTVLTTTLTAPSLTSENSFDAPTQYVPVTQQVQWPWDKDGFRLKPYSITILRIPQKK